MKKILLFLLLLIPIFGYAQLGTYKNQQPILERQNFHNLSVDRYFGLPAGSAIPIGIDSDYYRVNPKRAGLLFADTLHNKLYMYGTSWNLVGGGNLDNTLTIGNSTIQTMNTGNIVSSSDTGYSIGIPTKRYLNIYGKRLILNDTATSLGLLANYNFVMKGNGHITGSWATNESSGTHLISFGEFNAFNQPLNTPGINNGPVMMTSPAGIGFVTNDGSDFAQDQRRTPYILAFSKYTWQGGQSTDGVQYGLTQAVDTAEMIGINNINMTSYFKGIKIGGPAAFLGTTLSPSNLALDVAGVTKTVIQGIRICPMTTTQRNAIISPVNGLQIFNITKGIMEIYDTQSTTPAWRVLGALLVSPNGTRWEVTIDNSGNVTYTSIP